MQSNENYESDSEESATDEEKEVPKKLKCTFTGCNAAFNRPNKLQRHLNFHKNERPYKCTYKDCQKAYTNSSHLKRHFQSHNVVKKSYQCKFCEAKISTFTNLKRHYKRAHDSERDRYCKECNVHFRKKNRYEEHMASHKNMSLYKCEKCGKMFPTHMKLKKHQISHIPKNYSCPVENCSEVFEKWALMVKHRKSEHNMNYQCSRCKEVFSKRSLYDTHRKTHKDNVEAAIPCPYENCNRLYYFKKNLNYHIRVKHIGKIYHCDICDKKLVSKQKIKEHIIRIHLSEKKPFKRKAPAPRIDIGLAKKSMLSSLTGIQLSVRAEKQLMNRNPAALLRDIAVEDAFSFSEDDRSSDVSAKCA